MPQVSSHEPGQRARSLRQSAPTVITPGQDGAPAPTAGGEPSDPRPRQ